MAAITHNLIVDSNASTHANMMDNMTGHATNISRVDNRAAAKLAAESATHHFNFEPLLTKLFSSEKDLLDTIHAVFPKGVKVCRKDKWKEGPHAGMHKKWRFVCECGGQPRRNFNGSPARRTKKIGCPFFINAFWAIAHHGPRITTASLYHLGHEEVEVNQQALAALTQEQSMMPTQLLHEHEETSSDPSKSSAHKEVVLNSLKLKMDFHLRYMVANYPLDFVVARVNEFLSAEGPTVGPTPLISSGALLSLSNSGNMRFTRGAVASSSSSSSVSVAVAPQVAVAGNGAPNYNMVQIAHMSAPPMPALSTNGVQNVANIHNEHSLVSHASTVANAPVELVRGPQHSMSYADESVVPTLVMDNGDGAGNSGPLSKGPHAARKRKELNPANYDEPTLKMGKQ